MASGGLLGHVALIERNNGQTPGTGQLATSSVKCSHYSKRLHNKVAPPKKKKEKENKMKINKETNRNLLTKGQTESIHINIILNILCLNNNRKAYNNNNLYYICIIIIFI